MVRGSTLTENPMEISAASTDFEGHVQVPLKGLMRAASGCSSCFGRVICNTKRLPHEENMLTRQGLRYRKRRHCLKNFSCISSCDVLPSVTSMNPVSVDKHEASYNTKHRSESLVPSRNYKATPNSNAGSILHRNLRRGLGGLLRDKGAATVDQSSPCPRRVSGSSFRTGGWCLMRPAVFKSDSRVNSVLGEPNSGRSGEDQGISRTSSDSCETSPLSLSNEGVLSQRLVRNMDGSCIYDGESDAAERRNPSGLWINSGSSNSSARSRDRPSLGSSAFAGACSGPRAARVPFLFGTAHRTRSMEVISSPSSYLSSPDVHLSNPDIVRSYSSTLQSPYFRRGASSPEYQEGYRVQSSSGTPVYRSFRQLPLQPFEEGQEYLTYGGISEQQVFMWEANLIFGGMPLHDQFRELRLDIDTMSYEDLLALQESIGDVCTGLKKDAITSCLRKKVHCLNSDLASSEGVSESRCSICQVDFEEGTELGVLKCGHNHHVQCIEEWLLRKNLCPICKTSAFTENLPIQPVDL